MVDYNTTSLLCQQKFTYFKKIFLCIFHNFIINYPYFVMQNILQKGFLDEK